MLQQRLEVGPLVGLVAADRFEAVCQHLVEQTIPINRPTTGIYIPIEPRRSASSAAMMLAGRLRTTSGPASIVAVSHSSTTTNRQAERTPSEFTATSTVRQDGEAVSRAAAYSTT